MKLHPAIQPSPQSREVQKLPEMPTREEAVQAATNFEAIFLRIMIKDMRRGASMLGGEGFFGQSVGADIKEGWFDTMMANRIARTRRVGLSDALLRDWEAMGRIPPAEEDTPEERETLDPGEGGSGDPFLAIRFKNLAKGILR